MALYERVKARHAALDEIDLLLKLRDLLVDHPAVRREFQRLFDHVFVDEFQDTDPLQAEIVLFLCEQDAVARRWDDVALRPGSLTLVGDPKQSIYRFRRADIGMYDHVRRIVARNECLSIVGRRFESCPGSQPFGAYRADPRRENAHVLMPRRRRCVKGAKELVLAVS